MVMAHPLGLVRDAARVKEQQIHKHKQKDKWTVMKLNVK